MRSSVASTPAARVMSERSSDGERVATASTELEGSIRTRLASSARAAARRTSGMPAPCSSAVQSSSKLPGFAYAELVAGRAGIG